ncbi:MAG: mechanosensitive ion channel family protein, partial [Hyphomonadaceae bacterium]
AIAIFWALHRLAGALRHVLKPLAELLTVSAVEWLVKSLQVIFLVVGAAAVLELWGVRIAPLLAGLGIFGVAVALGAQDLFKNLIAGLAVLAERRFQKGDWVLVDGVVEGTVEQINFRSTVVRRFDQGPVYVPNSKFADNAVVNFSRMTHRRIYWIVGVEYNTSVPQLQRIRDRIEAYLLESADFAKPPDVSLFVNIDKFNDSSIDFMIYCFTKTTNWGAWLGIKEKFAFAIKEIVESEGASFAFPSRTLYLASAQDGREVFEPPQAAPRVAPQRREAAGGE